MAEQDVEGNVTDQKRTWLHCRVAHNGQDGEEMLTAQRNRLGSCAKESTFDIVGSSSDIGSNLTFDRPGLLDFHMAVEDGDVGILLIMNSSRLGRDMSEVTKYWHMFRAIGVSVHTVDCGEINMSFDEMLSGMLNEIRKRSK